MRRGTIILNKEKKKKGIIVFIKPDLDLYLTFNRSMGPFYKKETSQLI